MPDVESGATTPENTNGGANGGDHDKDKKKVIAPEDHERALSDLNKFKKERDDAKRAADDFKARLEALEKTKAESAGDFKSLYEQQKAANEEMKTKYEGLKSSMVLTQKHAAASSALAKAGLKPEFFQFLEKEEFTEMEVESTSQGRFLVHGSELLVDNWKKRFPSAFGSGTPPTFNGGGGGAGGAGEDGDLTPAKLFEIEQACKKKGDMKPYDQAYEKYVQQKKKKMG